MTNPTINRSSSQADLPSQNHEAQAAPELEFLDTFFIEGVEALLEEGHRDQAGALPSARIQAYGSSNDLRAASEAVDIRAAGSQPDFAHPLVDAESQYREQSLEASRPPKRPKVGDQATVAPPRFSLAPLPTDMPSRIVERDFTQALNYLVLQGDFATALYSEDAPEVKLATWLAKALFNKEVPELARLSNEEMTILVLLKLIVVKSKVFDQGSIGIQLFYAIVAKMLNARTEQHQPTEQPQLLPVATDRHQINAHGELRSTASSRGIMFLNALPSASQRLINRILQEKLNLVQAPKAEQRNLGLMQVSIGNSCYINTGIQLLRNFLPEKNPISPAELMDKMNGYFVDALQASRLSDQQFSVLVKLAPASRVQAIKSLRVNQINADKETLANNLAEKLIQLRRHFGATPEESECALILEEIQEVINEVAPGAISSDDQGRLYGAINGGTTADGLRPIVMGLLEQNESFKTRRQVALLNTLEDFSTKIMELMYLEAVLEVKSGDVYDRRDLRNFLDIIADNVDLLGINTVRGQQGSANEFCLKFLEMLQRHYPRETGLFEVVQKTYIASVTDKMERWADVAGSDNARRKPTIETRLVGDAIAENAQAIDSVKVASLQDICDARFKLRTSDGLRKESIENFGISQSPAIEERSGLKSVPQNLILSLERRRLDEAGEHIDRRVFSVGDRLDQIELSVDVYDDALGDFVTKRQSFKCSAFATHQGGARGNCGHWVSFINQDNQWYLVNDHRVTQVDEASVSQASTEASVWVLAAR